MTPAVNVPQPVLENTAVGVEQPVRVCFIAVDVHHVQALVLVDCSLQRFHFRAVKRRVMPGACVDNEVVGFNQKLRVALALRHVPQLVGDCQRNLAALAGKKRFEVLHFVIGKERGVELVLARHRVAAVLAAHRVHGHAGGGNRLDIAYYRALAYLELVRKVPLRDLAAREYRQKYGKRERSIAHDFLLEKNRNLQIYFIKDDNTLSSTLCYNKPVNEKNNDVYREKNF